MANIKGLNRWSWKKIQSYFSHRKIKTLFCILGTNKWDFNKLVLLQIAHSSWFMLLCSCGSAVFYVPYSFPLSNSWKAPGVLLLSSVTYVTMPQCSHRFIFSVTMLKCVCFNLSERMRGKKYVTMFFTSDELGQNISCLRVLNHPQNSGFRVSRGMGTGSALQWCSSLKKSHGAVCNHPKRFIQLLEVW